MFHLAWPWMLLFLPLPWLLTQRWPAKPQQGTALYLPFAAGVASGAATLVGKGSRARRLLSLLVWLLLVFAALRPQWLGAPEPVPTTGRRVLLAVDVSGSMATQDMADGASRLQVVQKVAGDFIERRHGDQVGLILFGTKPYLQAPLTADLTTVHQFLQEAMVGVAGPQTAIGDAIGLAIKRLSADKSRHHKGDTVLILLTDGSSNAGVMPPLEAAKLAAEAGLRIYTIGVGAAAQQGLFGLMGGNDDLDEDTLKAIAKATGGEYFRATDASALQKVYARIDQLEPSAGRDQWYRPSTEWFPWPLGLALLLSLPLVCLRESSWT